jgi:predicted RNA methylase
MAVVKPSKKQTEFGDFQTPRGLAGEVCRLLSQRGISPRSVLEPTCGLGNFLVAAIESFPAISMAVGVEIDGDYVREARSVLENKPYHVSVEIRQEDFFRIDWTKVLDSLPDPLLVVGNPPWVTNAELGALGSSNLPEKSNFQNHRGIEAITGKGNLDISMEGSHLRFLQEARVQSSRPL